MPCNLSKFTQPVGELGVRPGSWPLHSTLSRWLLGTCNVFCKSKYLVHSNKSAHVQEGKQQKMEPKIRLSPEAQCCGGWAAGAIFQPECTWFCT